MKLLALCGSLRKESSNREILETLASLAPANVTVDIFDSLGKMPHFNPDIDREPLPVEVIDFREKVAACSGLIISTPEYAHALPGAFKNLLDWLVSDPRFVGKKVGIAHVDRGSRWAYESLCEVLKTMNAEIVREATVFLPLSSNKISRGELLESGKFKGLLVRSINGLVDALKSGVDL